MTQINRNERYLRRAEDDTATAIDRKNNKKCSQCFRGVVDMLFNV
jgi:hypothetical protein